MLLVRNSYLDRIRPYYESNLIKVLVGPRRSGKSEIMKMIEDEIRRGRAEPAKVISINFEDLAFDRIRTYRELNQYVLSKVEDP